MVWSYTFENTFSDGTLCPLSLVGCIRTEGDRTACRTSRRFNTLIICETHTHNITSLTLCLHHPGCRASLLHRRPTPPPQPETAATHLSQSHWCGWDGQESPAVCNTHAHRRTLCKQVVCKQVFLWTDSSMGKACFFSPKRKSMKETPWRQYKVTTYTLSVPLAYFQF